jgi:hypothetical protein
MAQPQPSFCPWCGTKRPTTATPCPSCKGPSVQALAESQPDPITFFGEDVPTLLYDDPATGGDGRYYVNPDKTATKFQWLTGQLNNSYPFALGANAQVKVRVPINPEVGMAGDTEVAAFLMTTTGRVAVKIFVPLLEKFLSNVLIPSNLMFGTAQLQALLAQTIYALPDYDWQIDMKEMDGIAQTISPVFFARRFLGSGDKKAEAARRATSMSKFMHPYVLGPNSAYNNTTSTPIDPTPNVAIPAGQSVTCTYSVPSDAYFDCFWILDDSTSTTAVEINDLFVSKFTEGGSGRSLIQVPAGSNGLSLRSFIAVPTVGVTGFPSGGGLSATGGIRAASLPGPAGTWSHLFSPGCDIQITYVSTDAGTITLRTALSGVAVYADLLKPECP